jgi:hypothetical protein
MPQPNSLSGLRKALKFTLASRINVHPLPFSRGAQDG